MYSEFVELRGKLNGFVVLLDDGYERKMEAVIGVQR